MSSDPGIPRATRQAALGEFLTAMRARLTPEDVGLRSVGRRRTPGLRRQEVAELAAMSIDWYVLDHCFDILAHNAAAQAMFGDGFGHGATVNSALMLFLDPDIRRTHRLSWEQVARETVGALRANAAKYPEDPRLQALIGRLRDGDRDFAAWWDDHRSASTAAA